jgi:hypothetical protein
MDMLVFVIDLGEADDDDVVTASMKFTLGGDTPRGGPPPAVGEWVRLHDDDEDETVYWGQVVEHVSDVNVAVQIDWGSCEPMLSVADWCAIPVIPYDLCEAALKQQFGTAAVLATAAG